MMELFESAEDSQKYRSYIRSRRVVADMSDAHTTISMIALGSGTLAVPAMLPPPEPLVSPKLDFQNA